MRLARILLRLANLEALEPRETAIPNISQGILAEMVGTTRSRVSLFMNGFRHSGFIEYSLTSDEVRVRPSLLDFYAEYALPPSACSRSLSETKCMRALIYTLRRQCSAPH